MVLQIGVCLNDSRTIDKTFGIISTLTGQLKGNADIINPVFVIATPQNLNINYCFCPEWGRYYYIDSVEVMIGGMVALHCRVDVLKSFSNNIKNLSVIIDKQESVNKSNLYLDDGSYVRLNKASNDIIEFTNGFNNQGTFILVCAGGEV